MDDDADCRRFPFSSDDEKPNESEANESVGDGVVGVCCWRCDDRCDSDAGWRERLECGGRLAIRLRLDMLDIINVDTEPERI